MPKIKKTPIIETPEIVRPSRAAKNKFNERLGLGLHAASPPRETTRPRRKRRAIRRFSSDDLPKLLNPKLDDEGENHSEDDGGYDENSMFEQSKEVSEGEEPMEGVENEQKEAQQPVENVEEEPAGSDNKILVYMDHDLTPVAAHLVHLNDFKEMSDYKTYHSHRFMCDICCTSCSDYQDYVKHVAGHGEIHAICALCQLPETPYSLNALSAHISIHFRKENDEQFCDFCNEKFTNLAGTYHLVQHLYFFCNKIPTCLICAHTFGKNESPAEHRRTEHARILDRFLCTACFRGFPTHEKRLKHECELTLRCVCDLCVTYKSVDELIAHLKASGNPQEHGFIVPHRSSHREMYIDNPHSICSTNYEENIRQTRYPIHFEAQQQAKRIGLTTPTAATGGCRTRRARISPSENKLNDRKNSFADVAPTRSFIRPTLVRSTSLEFSSPSPPPVSEGSGSMEPSITQSSPSSSIENEKPKKSTSIYDAKVVFENQVLIKNGLMPYVQLPPGIRQKPISNPRPPPIVLPRNPVFRLQVQGQTNNGTTTNAFANVRFNNTPRMLNPPEVRTIQVPSTVSTLPNIPNYYGQRYPPSTTFTSLNDNTELKKQTTEEIKTVMRNQYLKSREQYELFQQKRGIQHDITEVFKCFCSEEGFTLYHYLEHLEQAHYIHKRLNSPIVPKNATLSICRKCKLTFESSLQFGIHMRRHNAIRQNPKNCPDCSSVVMKDEDLDGHERIEKTKWICARCNQKFSTEINFFGHVAKKLDHGTIFYFCTSCCIGNSEPYDIYRHVMSNNRCSPYARIGYILMDTLQHRPILIDKYNDILRPINLMPPQNSCNQMVDLEVHPGDVILKSCCNRLHRYVKMTDSAILYSSNWNATTVTSDLFLKIHQKTPFVAEWHLTMRGYPDLLPDLDHKIKQKIAASIPRTGGIIRMLPRQENIQNITNISNISKNSPIKELKKILLTENSSDSSPPADPNPPRPLIIGANDIIQIDDEDDLL